jgi:hypothetical protein
VLLQALPVLALFSDVIEFSDKSRPERANAFSGSKKLWAAAKTKRYLNHHSNGNSEP